MAIWLLLCALAPLLSGCAGPQKRQYEFYDAFDTVIRLTAYTRDEASFRRLCEQAEAEFSRYDAIFDRYEAHEGVQGVWALNHAQGEATPVEPELLVDSAERPEDIDANRARLAEERAREELLQKRSLREYRMAEANLARALNRLRVSRG